MSTEHKIVDLDPAEAKARLDRGEAVLVDVREPYEYGAERIPGALLYPLVTFDPKALPAMWGDRMVILQCGTGRRSGMAAQRMIEAGAGTVHHVKGGLNAWREAKLPILGLNPTTGVIEPKSYG